MMDRQPYRLQCTPLRARWHAHLRALDRRFVLRAIQAKERRLAKVEAAWEAFKAESGQTHWHCDCAQLEDDA